MRGLPGDSESGENPIMPNNSSRRRFAARLNSGVSAALRATLTAELAAPAGSARPDLFFACKKEENLYKYRSCENAPRADSRSANKSFERKSASLRLRP